MRRMSEEEFEITVKNNCKNSNSDKCEHDIVRICQNGMHLDYGCIKCGATHTDYNSLKNHI